MSSTVNGQINIFLTGRIRLPDVLAWDRNSYLTHLLSYPDCQVRVAGLLELPPLAHMIRTQMGFIGPYIQLTKSHI